MCRVARRDAAPRDSKSRRKRKGGRDAATRRRRTCDDGVVDDDATRELRRLQARAYGPDADIADDPAALRRLRELEDEARPAAPDPPATDPDAAARRSTPAAPGLGFGGVRDATPADTTPAEAPGETVPADAPAEAAQPAIPVKRWLFLAGVWAASLVLVSVLVGATTWSAALIQLRPIWQGVDGRQVAVLQIDPDFIKPGFFGTEDDLRGFEDFYGLTVISSPDGWAGPRSGDECLFAARSDNLASGAQSLSGPLWTTCSAGGFPAVLQF